MKIMADLDAVHLGLDENEADIAEELQDFDDSFDTRSEASESGCDSSDTQPSISSVSTTPSSIGEKRKSKTKKKQVKEVDKKNSASKRAATVATGTASSTAIAVAAQNGKTSSSKKKRTAEVLDKSGEVVVEAKKSTASEKHHKKSQKKSTSTTASNGGSSTAIQPNATVGATSNSGGINKSDISETEEKPIPPFESDSESEDSDSAANIKRNGRAKSAAVTAAPTTSSTTSGTSNKVGSPDKKANASSASASTKTATTTSTSSTKSYDYKTKLNYLFRDTRFFLIKSNNADNIALSKSKNVWATLPQNDANLNQAFEEARNVLLIFSVNESGKFAGFARMSAHSRRDIPQVAWVLPPSISSKALGGVIEIDWICRKELSFNCTSHLYNSWNEGKPVKIGRDGQEIEPKVGAELCRLFPEDEKAELTPILRKSKETAKMMREKGIRVVYKQPRTLTPRGGRGGSGGGLGYRHAEHRRLGVDGIGPLRHKRSYGFGPHRPYKMPLMGGPPGGFKRSASPYRSGPNGPGGGGSRAGGGDVALPPWERYMNAAAAEAYVADYMRTMHGQLPPLPFVPPFAQLPLSGSGSGSSLPPSGPPSVYEQLPPPVRYYDGPPLPDYPPPQPLRPQPPGFDKAPSYEDIAAWKNAGLPTVPGALPPGFPTFGQTSLSTSNGAQSSGPAGLSTSGAGSFAGGSTAGSGGGGGGTGSGGSAPNSYRNRESATINRSRERGGGIRDYHRGGGSAGGGTSRSGSDRERHFRAGGNDRGGGHRNYREGRR